MGATQGGISYNKDPQNLCLGEGTWPRAGVR